MHDTFNLAPYIDHTLLKATASKEDIDQLCKQALKASFAAVCVPPYYVGQARRMLNSSPVKTATVVGFPLGYHCVSSKYQELVKALADGVQELDIVINIAAFKSQDWSTLEQEMDLLLPEAAQAEATTKIILESGVLSEEELSACCLFYGRYPIHYMKTSTGFAEKGASVAAVRLMRARLPAHIQIKASGGIKDRSFALELIQAGATRIGTSSSLALIQTP